MKKSLIYIVTIFFVISLALSQDDAEAIKKKTAQFNFFVGNWSQKYFFTGAESPPLSGQGNMTCKLINKDNIIEMDCQMPINKFDSFIRKIYMGYDKITDKYYIVFLDANSTAPYYGVGDYNKEAKTYNFIGKYNQTDSYKVDLRVVIKIDRDDKFVYTVTKIDGVKDERLLEVGSFKEETPKESEKPKKKK